ncbi:MAG: sigma 54-interacting transcriptional regulator [Pseudomonadota bacterium]
MECDDRTERIHTGAGRPWDGGDPRRVFLVTEEGKMRYVLLDREGILIGSGRDADLLLGDPTVSRRHCRLRAGPDGPLLEDLGSTNGTRIGGTPAGRGLRPVAPPALLTLGRHRLVVLPGVEVPGAGVAMRLGELVSANPSMARVFFAALAAAHSELPLLLQGASGTGKDLLAQAIHGAGPTARGPWIPVNCATLAPERAEVELFGCRKGAYTGAVADRPGLLAAANGGTLFLDEVAELPLPVQARLLRALEGQPIRPVGDHRSRAVQVRIIAASNASLPDRVRSHRFRADLFFRLHVLPVHLPPLRDRPEDVPLLTAWLGRSLPGLALTQEGAALLVRYPWPGNVRELRTVLQRVAALGGGAAAGREAVLEALEAGGRSPDDGKDAGDLQAPVPGLSTSQLLRILGIPRSTYYHRRAREREGIRPSSAAAQSPMSGP